MSLLQKICRNPTFVVCIVVGIFESIIINGFAAFMPKILETLLSTTPIFASYLSSIVIFAAAAGVMVGGTIIRKLRLQIRGWNVENDRMLSCGGANIHYWPTCSLSPKKFCGEIHHNIDHNISSSCNMACSCKVEWNPVCHQSTGYIYYSACFAGCTKKSEDEMNTTWSACSCLSPNSTFHGSTTVSSDILIRGYCHSDCGYSVYILMLTLFVTVVSSFASGIPTQQVYCLFKNLYFITIHLLL
uniref:Kazal-like domain-containing protein n=1 Tax=Heterorhabditis bacteriophora TaxID=37862 RepID=A0A1I7WUY4_HETBA